MLSAEGALAIGGMSVDALPGQAEAYVRRVAAAAAKAGVACTTLTAYGYSPADKIVEAATRTGCDLVFMASHGRRGLSRLIAGSVTQHVRAHSTVPVMVHRPQPAQAHGRAVDQCRPDARGGGAG